jgi:diguanylate cyclase (GGDEF)-like protein
VDDFAKVNAESGPAMGDVLLTCLAGVVLNSVRSVDIAGRFRGEQFLMYLPETDEEGAKAFAVRMQDKLGTIADAVAGYRLTFSCGIVGAPKDGTDLEPLLNCLVNALVTAKARTPGSIVLWGVDIAEREFEKQGLSEI